MHSLTYLMVSRKLTKTLFATVCRRIIIRSLKIRDRIGSRPKLLIAWFCFIDKQSTSPLLTATSVCGLKLTVSRDDSICWSLYLLMLLPSYFMYLSSCTPPHECIILLGFLPVACGSMVCIIGRKSDLSNTPVVWIGINRWHAISCATTTGCYSCYVKYIVCKRVVGWFMHRK